MTLEELLSNAAMKIDAHLMPSIAELVTDLRHCPGDLSQQQKDDTITAYRRSLAEARECVLAELVEKLKAEGWI